MSKVFCTIQYLLSAFMFFIPVALFAQGSGSISGKIIGKETGEPLIGVTILLKGTSKGAISDVQGNYLIRNIPTGIYSLSFKYLGYGTKYISEVKINPGVTTRLSPMLSASGSQQLDEVIVTATYRQASINALYSKRKNSSVLSDGISAEQISRSPDGNTADVLKRISGASVQDQKFVVIRGLASRYNATMMNGAVMPSTEPDKKAFSFNIVPANLIDQVIISKTASPALPGNAAGGTIQINTKDFPDRKFMTLSVGTGYETQTTFQPFYTGGASGKYDVLGLYDGSNDLPDAFQNVRKDYARLSTAQKLAITREFPNTFGSQKAGESLPPIKLKFSAGNTKLFENGNKFGYIAAVNFSTERNTLLGNKTDYLLNKEQLYSYQDRKYKQTYAQGALLNFAYTFDKNKISLKNFFSNKLSRSVTKRTGKIFDGENNHFNFRSLNSETSQNGLFNSVLQGQHQSGWHRLYIDWSLSYGLSYRNKPDQQIVSAYQIDQEEPYFLQLSNENSPAIKSAGRVYSNLEEDIFNGKINLSLPFQLFNKEQKLQFGFSKTLQKRSFSILALGYASALDPNGGGATIRLDKGVNFSNIFSPENLDRYKILLANIPQNTKDYTGKVDLNAGYLMFDTHFSNQWRLVWGARLEQHHQQLIAVNQPVQEYKKLDVLPSANLTWSAKRNLNIRLAYSRTVNRPLFREVASFRYYDYENDFIISGNPNLQRSINDNIDFRIAYYPSTGEVLSFSAFYKKFDHPIEQTNQGNRVLTYNNADQAMDYGIELGIRKKLDFINASTFFNHLTIFANASFIKGEVRFEGKDIARPLQGQSPYMINGGLSYVVPKKLAVSVLYNRMGQRLQFRGENEGLDTYEKARDLLDFQISKQLFHQQAEVKLSVSDILAQSGILYYNYGASDKTNFQPGQDKIISSVTPGTNFSLSFTYRF